MGFIRLSNYLRGTFTSTDWCGGLIRLYSTIILGYYFISFIYFFIVKNII